MSAGKNPRRSAHSAYENSIGNATATKRVKIAIGFKRCGGKLTVRKVRNIVIQSHIGAARIRRDVRKRVADRDRGGRNSYFICCRRRGRPLLSSRIDGGFGYFRENSFGG